MSRAVHGLSVRPGTCLSHLAQSGSMRCLALAGVVLVDGCNRPPDLLAPGEKWTRMSQKDLEARKNQTKLAQWFKKPAKAEAEPWRPKARCAEYCTAVAFCSGLRQCNAMSALLARKGGGGCDRRGRPRPIASQTAPRAIRWVWPLTSSGSQLRQCWPKSLAIAT